MAESSRRTFELHSDAVGDGILEVVGFSGYERIGQCFRFELELASSKSDLSFDDLLSTKAYLKIWQPLTLSGGGKGRQALKIHGVFSSFEQGGRSGPWILYRATLVPELWRMSLGFQTQIHLDKTYPDIVKAELGGATSKYGFPSAPAFGVQCSGPHPKREYVVQYLESDLNFIQRLCEHEGIFYFFAHDEAETKALFSDAKSKFLAIPAPAPVLMREPGELGLAVDSVSWEAPECVHSITYRQTVIPAKVALNTYWWMTPSVAQYVELPVDTKGAFATFYEYGNDTTTTTEGKDLAQVRVNEILSQKKVFTGSGNVKSFRAGYTFTLSEHYRSDLNISFLLTDVRHHATQPLEFIGGTGGMPTYRNEFTAIPASAPYVPPRTTPKPRVHGLFLGKIDAGGSGEYAEIDDHGRYKVQLPFDLSGRGGGTASRWIRMAQPYAGGGMGFHCPLHKGTEVALAHVNGNPDDPIIVGALTNPETANIVTGGNQTQCKLHTGGGNSMTIEDSAGGQRIAMYSPTEETFFSMGAPPA